MKRGILTSYESEKFLEDYIPVSNAQLVNSLKEIKIRPPLVLKIVSPNALHKTEINGVRIVKSIYDVETEFRSLQAIAKKNKLKLEGILVQKFIEGEQLIIGLKKDEVFNHIILFGIGGTMTELYEDTSIRKCPITFQDAQEMIDELKAKKLFYGFRGKKLNTDLLKKTLVTISQIPMKHKTLKEMDINPFILNEKTGACVDARILFD
jgi:hypothetical protein